jgi:hypothetical protein
VNYFCTLFDIRYTTKGLALYRSLLSKGEPYHLWILCMDRETFEQLSCRNLESTTLLTINDLERSDETVTTVKNNRSLVEFYFTSKSFLCLYILGKNPNVQLLTYLDADFFFIGSPSAIIYEMSGYSIGLTGHRFPSRLKTREQFGKYNAGFISFRNDDAGISCLRWWRDQCVAWCHDYVENDRFADQRYLDLIPAKFQRVTAIKHKGINLAPWNISQYKITWDGNNVLVDDDPLILYHFHGLKKIGDSWYESGLSPYNTSLSAIVRKYVYGPYIADMQEEASMIPSMSAGISIRQRRENAKYDDSIWQSIWTFIRNIKTLLKGIYYRSFIKR